MIKKLALNSVFSRSFKYIKQHFKLLGAFFVFSFAGILTVQLIDPTDSLLQMFLYLVYTYLFYYFFTRCYFKQKPLWSFSSFKDALIRMVAITLLAFAGLVLLRIGLYALYWLLSPLQYLPSTKEAVNSFMAFFIQSSLIRYALYLFMFALLTVMFFIPSLAWVSAAIGRDSSITLTFFRTRGNYIRLMVLFLLIFGLLPVIIISLSGGSVFLSSVLSAVYTLIQTVIYLQVYETFYPRPRKKKISE